MAGKISLKRAAVVIFSFLIVLIMGACMEPVDFEAFMDDEKVKELIETTRKAVKVDDQTGDDLTGRNGKIEGLKTDRYYMVEKEVDEAGANVPEYRDQGTYPMYVTDHNGFGPGGLYGDLGFITRISDGSINGLINFHTYTVRAAEPLSGSCAYTDDSSNAVSKPITSGVINIGGIDGSGTLNLSTVLTGGTYEVIAVLPVNNPQTSPGSWSWTSKTANLTSFALEGPNTQVDYVFVNEDDPSDFKVLKVVIGGPIGPDVPINIAAIVGVTVPVTGVTPVPAITPTAQYTGTISWTDGGVAHTGPFAASTVYTATITLTALPGYTLTGVAANFFTVVGTDPGTPTTNLINSGVVTATFPATGVADTVINGHAITGVTSPVTGATPSTTAITGTGYTGDIAWTIVSPTTFAPDTVYTATITLNATTGYTFTGTTGSFTVNGITATVTPVSASSISLSVTFPATDPAPSTIINGQAIASVTVPVNGATDATAITDTEFTGAVVWSPALTGGNFASDTIYTATITLTAESGYTFTGTTGNFTVAGTSTPATITGSTGATLTISATFPRTDKTISIAVIPGVTAPETGKAPVFAITPTAEYTGTITWTPTIAQAGGTALSNTVYTATITLAPTTGYTLAGVGANFFTVAGAAATNPINSGAVSAVFPVTDTTVTTLAITGITAPVAGDTPYTTPITGTEYGGTITWSPTPTGGKFAAGTAYSAIIDLTVASGYTFTGVGAFTVSGSPTSVTPSLNAGPTIRLTALFPATAATITTSVIPGVIRPAINATAVMAITPTAQYTGTVAWAPALTGGKFDASTVYTATITLAPTAGYTLEGVGSNFFTVAGTSTPATNAANSGVVTAVFPATAAVDEGMLFTISFSIADKVTISADGSNATTYNAIKDNNGYLKYSLTGGFFTNVTWYFDGVVVGSGATLTIDKNTTYLEEFTVTGAHYLVVTGALNGKPYTNTIKFTITNDK
jgi:hypothetical protein